MMRVGIGFDAHKFTPNRPLVLGGVHIPFPLGLKGYSDADVVIHAIIDAILGAISEGDIGLHFPDTDESYRDISSLTLLSEVKKILTEREYKVVNLDVVVALEEPKIAPFRDEMKGKIAHTLDMERDQVNVKATTTEGLGFTGRREGIAAYAVALVEEI
ncbi:MAG: 2-C-methyl-D-erythritol 2,4-cyclodiphosphate synthase [Actinomycetota bacterium]